MRWGGIFDLEGLRRQVERLDAVIAREGFWDDPERAQKTTQERAAAQETVETHGKLAAEVADLQDLLELIAEASDEGMLDELDARLPELERGVRSMEVARMLSGKEDRSDAIVSIHPGAGGVDAQDWAEMLMRMYLRWAERRGFQTEMLNHQVGDEAGVKEVSFAVKGPFAYGFLRAENGVHRLIRISPFDANARRHTAFAAVYVVPDLDDDLEEIEIKDEDLDVDTFRAGGKGGQHVNKTESAIRITHVPSGIIVKCQAERSQHQNRARAMKMLRGLLYERARQEQEAAFESAYGGNKQEIGFGSQVRTYTLQPYTMVKDERTEHKKSDAQGVLDGDLDDFIEAFLLEAANRRDRQGEGGASAGATAP
jgi:peptide chain release factor 2